MAEKPAGQEEIAQDPGGTTTVRKALCPICGEARGDESPCPHCGMN